jgi:hypothetical protein
MCIKIRVYAHTDERDTVFPNHTIGSQMHMFMRAQKSTHKKRPEVAISPTDIINSNLHTQAHFTKGTDAYMKKQAEREDSTHTLHTQCCKSVHVGINTSIYVSTWGASDKRMTKE